jgi:hypothetical protein
MAAAIRSLQPFEQVVHAIETRVRVAFVPDPHREQHQHVEEVVVEQDRDRGRIRRFVTPLRDQVVQNVDGDGVREDGVGSAVPVAQHVESFPGRARVVGRNDRREVGRARTRLPRVDLHCFSQAEERRPALGRA